MHIEPPVNKFSPASELEDWIGELEGMLEDPALQEQEHQAAIRRHLNDARAWLQWDLHRKVMEEGREATDVLREVGALDREHGDPPPEG